MPRFRTEIASQLSTVDISLDYTEICSEGTAFANSLTPQFFSELTNNIADASTLEKINELLATTQSYLDRINATQEKSVIGSQRLRSCSL